VQDLLGVPVDVLGRLSAAAAWTFWPTRMMESKKSCRKVCAIHRTVLVGPVWMAVGSSAKVSAVKA